MRCSPQPHWQLLAKDLFMLVENQTWQIKFGPACDHMQEIRPFSATNLPICVMIVFSCWKTKIAFHLYLQALKAFCMICRRQKKFDSRARFDIIQDSTFSQENRKPFPQ
jgi:hypothetical protein